MPINDDGDGEGSEIIGGAVPASPEPPPLRLVAGLGDPEREQALLPALAASGQFVVVERCLAAEQLLATARDLGADVVLVAFDLHRLTDETLQELARSRIPHVLLIPTTDDGHWQNNPGLTIPLNANASVVEDALLAAVRGDGGRSAPAVVERHDQRGDQAEAPAASAEAPAVIAVTSGHGSPGGTTLALNLAVALGAVAPTLLVDADVTGPSVAAYLDADPTRNLSMVMHAEPANPRDWDRALAQETQSLGPRSPHGAALCGIPKLAMRTGVTTSFFARLLAELRPRYQYVILDVGADLLGDEVALHRTALAHADQIVLVAAADLVGLWHARQALGLLRDRLGIERERLALIVNRYDRRYHHTRPEIEWALGVPMAALIPDDHRAVQRAIVAQRPLVLDSRGRAARAVLDLAERVHGGRILLPPEPAEKGHRQGFGVLAALWPRWPLRSRHLTKNEGVPHGSDAASVG